MRSLSCLIKVLLTLLCIESTEFSVAQSNPCSITSPGASLVSVDGRRLMVAKRNPDGSLMPSHPYRITGVCWSPAGRNTNSSTNDRRKEFLNWYKTDIPLLRKMNVNTVRTFMDFGEGDTTKKILDEFYCNDIMVILTVDDASNDTARVRRIVNANKNHPAVLCWLLGNEWNINRYYGVASSVPDAAHRTQVAATLIKSLDLNHPVATSYGDIDINDNGRMLDDTKHYVNDTCTNVDIFGLNIYRGKNFGILFSQWKFITGKPMFLSEFGTDAFRSDNTNNPPTGQVDEQMQATWDMNLWNEAFRNLSANNPINVAIGGTVFEWNDEWWKAGSIGVQNTGGYTGAHPDTFANEEYFGLINIDRNKRIVFDSLRKGFHPAYNAPASTINFKTTSAGFNVPGTSNGFARFYKDSSLFYDGGSDFNIGFNVTAIDTTTGELITLSKYYNTWGSRTTGSEMRKMMRFLDSLPNGTLIMMSVRDEAGLDSFPPSSCGHLPYTWVDSCYTILEALGSTKIRNYCFRNSWAMVAVKGEGMAREEQLRDSLVATASAAIHLAPTFFAASLPLVPVAVSPACDTAIMSFSIRINWSRSESSASYHIQIAHDSLFTTLYKDTATADTTLFVQNFTNNKTYYWRSKANSTTGSSKWSCTRRISVRIPPVAEVLFSPVKLPADSLKIKYRFFNLLNTGNNFIIQITDTSGNPNSFRQIRNFILTDSAGTFVIPLSDTTFCSSRYKVRVLSTVPVDTSGSTANFEITNKHKPTISQTGTQLQSSLASSYQWFRDNILITGATGQFYTPVISGFYRVQVIKFNCLSDTSDSFNFIVTATTDPPGWLGVVLIFPNPFSKELTIINNDLSKKLFFEFYDISGKLIITRNLQSRNSTVDLKKISKGTYIAILTDKKKKESIKRIITKL